MAYFIRHNKKGFSLAELGIAMVILLVIATIATISYFAIIDNAKEVKVVEEAKTVQTALVKEDIREFSTEADFASLEPKVQDILKYHYENGTNLNNLVFKNEVLLSDGEYILGQIRVNASDVGGVSLNTLGDLLFSNIKVNAASEDEIKVRKLDNNKMNKLLQDNLKGDWYVVSNAKGSVADSGSGDGSDDGGNNTPDPAVLCDIAEEEGYKCISTPEELDNIRNELSNRYKYRLVNDIDMSGWGNFEPINGANSLSDNFEGVLDGDGFTISNLTIDSTKNYVGIFGQLEGGTVKNLTIKDSNIKGSGTNNSSTGTLAGLVGTLETHIENVHVINTEVTGGNKVGGVIGDADTRYYKITMDKLSFSGNVNGSKDVGGIAGFIKGDTIITNSFSEGKVTASSYRAGGIVGSIGQGMDIGVKDSYSHADVTAANLAGGISGTAGSDIWNVYATGNINTTSSQTGGITGGADAGTSNSLEIKNSFALNQSLSSPGTKFGIIGSAYNGSSVIVTDLYAIDNISGVTSSEAAITRLITSSDAMSRSTYENLGWDFGTIWVIEEGVGYPTLQWQN